MINSLLAIEDAQALATAIVNTIHEPFVILDADLKVIAASRSFYETFQVDPENTRDCALYELGDGQWDIPPLRMLLETIIPQHTAMDDFEVETDFPRLGQRTMLLNARRVLYETTKDTTILLAFTDITTRRLIERERAELLAQTEDLLRQKRVLLQEMEHRVANSLQIIASILLLKAKAVSSPESREHLRDAHQRVMSVAAVQSHLRATDGIEMIEVGPYLTKLCVSLATSIIAGAHPPHLKVVADEGQIGSAQAVSLGLIVTELVINALKYAFPDPKADAAVVVTYESDGPDWRLTVADNGIGRPANSQPPSQGGLGTVIVAALVKQLNAELAVRSVPVGLEVTIARAALHDLLPKAA